MLAFIAGTADWLEMCGVEGGAHAARLLRSALWEDRRSDRENTDPDVLVHLDTTLAATEIAEIVETFRGSARSIAWTAAPSGKLTRHMDGRAAYARIVGPDEALHSRTIWFGAFLMAPHTWYPPHSHAAGEIYMVLSGTALWQVGRSEFTPMPPGSVFHHRPWEPHATWTLDEPLLTLWAWHGDLRPGRYRIEPEHVEACDVHAIDALLFADGQAK